MIYKRYGFGLKNLDINFTNTKIDEPIKINSTYIDFDGQIKGGPSSKLFIRGGDGNSIYTVTQQEADPSYMTQAQRITLMQVLKGLAETSDDAEITSTNGHLQEVSISIYRNYCG